MTGCVKLFGGKNRGDYTEITYYDETGNQVDPEEASRIRIREILSNGAVVKETWGFVGKPDKRTA